MIPSVLIFLFLATILFFAFGAPWLASRATQAGTYAVYDMAGKPLYMRKPVQKGMIFAPVADNFIIVDNSAKHVTALAPYIRDEAARTMLGKIFPDLLSKQTAHTVQVTQPLGVEQTLLLNPDVVLLYDFQAQPFEAAGFPGLARITSIRDREEKMFSLLEGLTGQSQRRQSMFSRRQVLLEKLFASIPQNKPPVTTLTLSHKNYHLFSSLFENFNTNLRRCNAINLAEKPFAPSGVMNVERLLKLNPEVIFLYDYRNDLTVQDIYGNEVLSGLQAVRNQRVYRMPRGIARMTGPVEEPLLFYWMTQLLHPEITPVISFRQLVKETYHDVFGYPLTDADVDDILNMRANESSTGYHLFSAYSGK